MKPIDDGELQAFLDGEEAALGEKRAEEIRGALAEDPETADRLERLREESVSVRGLLDSAAQQIPMGPSFDVLRERASAGNNVETRGTGRRWPVAGAWGAALIAASAAGWMIGVRNAEQPLPGAFAEPAASVALEAESSAAPTEVQVGRLEEDTEVDQAEQELLSAEQGLPGAEQGTSGVAQGPPDAEGGLPPAELARVTAEQARPSAAMLSERVAADAVSPPLGISLFVPGLRVINVGFEEAEGDPVLRVDQVLPLGDTIQIRFLGMLKSDMALGPEGRSRGDVAALANPFGSAALRPGWHQVTMRHAGHLIVARAPIPEAEIRALLMTLP